MLNTIDYDNLRRQADKAVLGVWVNKRNESYTINKAYLENEQKIIYWAETEEQESLNTAPKFQAIESHGHSYKNRSLFYVQQNKNYYGFAMVTDDNIGDVLFKHRLTHDITQTIKDQNESFMEYLQDQDNPFGHINEAIIAPGISDKPLIRNGKYLDNRFNLSDYETMEDISEHFEDIDLLVIDGRVVEYPRSSLQTVLSIYDQVKGHTKFAFLINPDALQCNGFRRLLRAREPNALIFTYGNNKAIDYPIWVVYDNSLGQSYMRF